MRRFATSRRGPARALVPILATAAAFILFSTPCALRADDSATERALESWLSADCIGYAKVHRAGERLTAFLDSSLVRDFKASPIGEAVLGNPKAQEFLRGLEELETQAKVDPLELFGALFGQEVAIGARLTFDGPEVVLVTRASGVDALGDALATVRRVVTERLGLWPAREIDTHEGHAIEGTEQLVWSVAKDVLVISNTIRGVKRSLDLGEGRENGSISTSESFKAARQRIDSGAIAGIALRPRYVPDWTIPEQVENVVASLFVTPWLEALRKSDLIALSLRSTSSGVALEASAALDPETFRKKWAGFFPDGSSDSLIPRITRDGKIAAVEIHRDLASVWEDAERYVIAKGIGEMRQLDQVLTIVFGRSFVDEVLPELRSSFTIVVESQDYAKLGARPVPEIPGFALVFGMKEADRFSKNLQAALQSFIGIVNADRASKKKGGGMLLVEPEQVESSRMFAVTSIDAAEAGSSPGIEFNFSPALAIVGDRVILSSSRDLCAGLIRSLTSSPGSRDAAAGSSGTSRDRVLVDGKRAREILARNRDVLVAGEMLEKGKSREEAAAGIDGLLTALEWVRGLEVTSGLDEHGMRLRLELEVAKIGSSGSTH